MNRAERRKAAKQQKGRVKVDAWQAAKWAEKRLKEEAGHITQDVTQTLYWTALWVLYNKYDWKRFRLDRFRAE